MAKGKGKQDSLPGMTERRIEELHAKALEYVGIRDSRMELTEQEVELKGELMELMKKHKKDKYVCEGVEMTIVAGEPNLKVKVKKEATETDSAKVSPQDGADFDTPAVH
jgi:hypothetical protein